MASKSGNTATATSTNLSSEQVPFVRSFIAQWIGIDVLGSVWANFLVPVAAFVVIWMQRSTSASAPNLKEIAEFQKHLVFMLAQETKDNSTNSIFVSQLDSCGKLVSSMMSKWMVKEHAIPAFLENIGIPMRYLVAVGVALLHGFSHDLNAPQQLSWLPKQKQTRFAYIVQTVIIFMILIALYDRFV